MSSPEEAQALKAKQLASLAELNAPGGGMGGGGGMGQLALMGGGGHYGPGPGSGGGGGGPLMLKASSGYGHEASGDEVHETIQVPNALVGSLIGRGGENIQTIQRNSGCHVQIGRAEDQPPSAPDRPVSLRGTPQSVQLAKQEIDRVLGERQQRDQQQSQQRGPGGGGMGGGGMGGGESLSLKVPNQQVGLIIGKAGTTIRGIQERSGANLQIPAAADVDDPANRTICITAPSRQQVRSPQITHRKAIETFQR
jgi:far upstream element-binding protein